jgi:hypothetical protein
MRLTILQPSSNPLDQGWMDRSTDGRTNRPVLPPNPVHLRDVRVCFKTHFAGACIHLPTLLLFSALSNLSNDSWTSNCTGRSFVCKDTVTQLAVHTPQLSLALSLSRYMQASPRWSITGRSFLCSHHSIHSPILLHQCTRSESSIKIS